MHDSQPHSRAVWPGMQILVLAAGADPLDFASRRAATSARPVRSAAAARFGSRFPLDAIVAVQHRTRYTPELAWKNFGLSMDRLLHPRYRKPSARLALLGAVVSPKDKEGFLRELCQELKGLPNEGVVEERL